VPGRAPRALVTRAILKELPLAMSHRHTDGAVVLRRRRDEGQPPQNGDDGDNVDDGPRLRLLQLLRSALARLFPPGEVVPAANQKLKFTLSFNIVSKTKKSLFVACTLLTGSYCGAQRTCCHLQSGALA
jgi:hypothetical protein